MIFFAKSSTKHATYQRGVTMIDANSDYVTEDLDV